MVRCIDCGFLTYKHNETLNFEEVDMNERMDGSFGPYRGTLCDAPVTLSHKPHCLMTAANLGEEYKEECAGKQYFSVSFDSVKSVICRERKCTKFVKYRQGYSPKEHHQMLLEDENRNWMAQQKRADQEWQDKQKDKDREWQQSQKRWDRLFSLLMLIVGAVLTLAVQKYFPKSEDPPKSQSAPPKSATQS